MSQLFAFDKYAIYIWSAYGITAVVMLFSLLQPYLQKRQLLQRLTRLHQGENN